MTWKRTIERLKKILLDIADSSASLPAQRLEAERQLLQLVRLEVSNARTK